jgi:cytochrome c553
MIKNEFSLYWIYFLLIFSSLSMLSCTFSTNTYKEGAILYKTQCAGCHGDQAEGWANLYPSLQSKQLATDYRNNLACWIKFGKISNTIDSNSRPSIVEMPAQSHLSDIEICNILNFLNSKIWQQGRFTLQEINLQLNSCELKSRK